MMLLEAEARTKDRQLKDLTVGVLFSVVPPKAAKRSACICIFKFKFIASITCESRC